MINNLQPASSVDVHHFMAAYRELCPTVNDEISVEAFARRLNWTISKTVTLAHWLVERGLIETNAGLGDDITVIEGRSGT